METLFINYHNNCTMYICGCIHYETCVYRKLVLNRIVEIAEPAASKCKFRCYVLIPHFNNNKKSNFLANFLISDCSIIVVSHCINYPSLIKQLNPS